LRSRGSSFHKAEKEEGRAPRYGSRWPEDILTSCRITDVRCKPGTNASVCTGANAADGPDYSGDLQGNAIARVTDHYNGILICLVATVR
jgi:hypothetical protein